MAAKPDEITAASLIQEVIQSYPETVEVFVKNRLQCAGCCISPFHTIADSAREYAVAIEPLLKDLNERLTGVASDTRE